MDLYGQPYAHAVYAQETTASTTTDRFVRDQARGRHLRRRLSADRARSSVGERERSSGGAGVPPLARPEDHGQERGRERLRHPSPDRPRRARAAGAGGARRDPGRVARRPAAREHRARRGHVGVDGDARAPRGRPAGAALVPGRALGGGSGRARHLRRLDRDDRPARRAREPGSGVPRGPRAVRRRRTSRSTRRSPRALDDVRRLDDPDRINAVVVLSDGAGTDVGRKQLLRKIAQEPVTEGTGVRIFTVAYGNRADADALQQIARTRAARSSRPARRTSRTSTGRSRPTSEPAVREIGRYRVEREIGRGGMAIVHLARQADLERAVALKELAGLWATDPTATMRFLREARLGGSLNHPNIVTVHEYFEHEGVPYIAMEFLARGSLRPLVGTLDGSAGRRRPRRHPRRPRPRRRARDRPPRPQAGERDEDRRPGR